MKNIGVVIALVLVGLYSPTGTEAQWSRTTLDDTVVTTFAVYGSTLLAGTFDRGIFRSTNDGDTWESANAGLTDSVVETLAVCGSDIFTSTVGQIAGGVYRSSNGGLNWSPVGPRLTVTSVWCFAAEGSNLYAGTDGEGILRSTNSWTDWSAVNNGIGSASVNHLAVLGSSVFAGIVTGLYRSTDSGTRWHQVDSGMPPYSVYALMTLGTKLFAAIRSEGVFITSNAGEGWAEVNTGLPPSRSINVFAGTESNLFAGVYGPDGEGIFLTTNFGLNWKSVNAGLQDTDYFRALVASSKYLFASTNSHGVWRRPLSEMIPSAVSTPLPRSTFTLNQNYPNPFNPSTTITFSLPERIEITLDVFDMLGRKVQTLANGWMDAGPHSVRFNGADLGNGVYIAQLTALGLRRETTMILNK